MLKETTKLKKSNVQARFYERKNYQWMQHVEATLNETERTGIIDKEVFDESRMTVNEGTIQLQTNLIQTYLL